MHDTALAAIAKEGRDFSSCKHPGGAVKLNLISGDVSEVIIQDQIFGVTQYVPVETGDKTVGFIGSWGKHAMQVCES